MRYILSKHAAEAIIKRQLRLEWLEQALDHPDLIDDDPYEPDFIHHLAKIEEFDNRVLRVVFNPHAVPIFIVTLFFDRRKKRISN